MKKVLSFVLAVLMVVSVFPLTLLVAFAEEAGTEVETVSLYENDFSDSSKGAD